MERAKANNYIMEKCSIVNELERWSCYQDPYFSNHQTLNAGYPRVEKTIPTLESYGFGVLYLTLSIFLVLMLNQLLRSLIKWKDRCYGKKQN